MNKAIVCAVVLMGLGMTCQASEKAADSPAVGSGRVAIVTADVRGKARNGMDVCLRATDAVFVSRTEGTRSLVQFWKNTHRNTNPAIWVENEYLAGESDFKPVRKWVGEPEYQVAEGDYSASYAFSPDGTFTLEEQSEGPTSTFRGQLYEAKGLIWARRDNAKTGFYFAYEYANMFVLRGDEHMLDLPNKGAAYGTVPDARGDGVSFSSGGCIITNPRAQ